MKFALDFFELIILLIIGGGYLAMKSYLDSKFKNVALKEDTKQLTEIVEGVKTTFQNDTEKLKYQLSVLTNKHNILFTEEKEAIVNFLSSFDGYFWTSKADFFDFNDSNYKELLSLSKILDSKFDEVQITISKLELFISNKDVIDYALLLFLYTIKLQDVRKKYNDKGVKLFELKVNQVQSLTNYRDGMFFHPSVDEVELLNAITRTEERLKQLEKEFRDEIKSYLERVLEQRKSFIDLSKDYIRKDLV